MGVFIPPGLLPDISGIADNFTAISNHVGDADAHREINDSGSAATDLFSAAKILTELSGKEDSINTSGFYQVGSFGVGTSQATYPLSVKQTDENTNYVAYFFQSRASNPFVAFVNTKNVGSASAGFGFEFRAKTSAQERSVAQFNANWTDITDGTRTSKFSLKTNNNGTFGEYFSVIGKITHVNQLNISGCPLSSSGLPSGSIWRDASAGNVIKVVP